MTGCASLWQLITLHAANPNDLGSAWFLMTGWCANHPSDGQSKAR